MGAGSMMKRALSGRPVATAEETQERLPKELALSAFTSDVISSIAYATDETLLALVLAGAAAAVFFDLRRTGRSGASGLRRSLPPPVRRSAAAPAHRPMKVAV